jgi:membrane protein involved in colicin uptake
MPKRSLEAAPLIRGATSVNTQQETPDASACTKAAKEKKKKTKAVQPEALEEVAASDLDDLFGGLSKAKKQKQMVRVRVRRAR